MFQETFRQKYLTQRMDQSAEKGDKKPGQDPTSLLQSLREATDQELEQLLADPMLDRAENAAVRQQVIQILAERRGADHVDELLHGKKAAPPQVEEPEKAPEPAQTTEQAPAEVAKKPAPAPEPEKKEPEKAPVPVEVPVKEASVKGTTPAEQAREAFKKFNSPLAEIIPDNLHSFVIDPRGQFRLRLPDNELLHLKEFDLLLDREISGNLSQDRATNLKGITAMAQIEKAMVRFRVEELILHGQELLMRTDHPVMRLVRLALQEFLVVLQG